ncbi:hypothetical protein M409DRAFT_30235 [Zasmidium cellare ATCC 36951]|uniref:F-box domain-containing protein n=1 Tax=Zasmidium cellare ATCC 36951 TaxID=1080233 RepID=A0A6A6BX45_ZASCE|nr:uncharacterized protein M409DRAFT_30235 [Zasmidium cellare ATCC 36951]KAF2159357.1 hypothetical protein M409DRAFT_30235 [Zasmidium cellare ATCC 36951]
MRLSDTGPIATRVERDRIMAKALPPTAADDHWRPSLQVPCKQQTVPFLGLPAEIRNRIYHFALPSTGKGDPPLLVASPVWDDVMVSAAEPGITRACKQTRRETLKLFYEDNDFHAYIEHLDFRGLIAWARHFNYTPKLRVHVYMLNKAMCHIGLTPFAQAWRLVEHPEKIHLELHSSFLGPGRRQCAAVAFTVNAAEQKRTKRALQSRMEGEFGEKGTCRCFDWLEIGSGGAYSCSDKHWVDY